MEIRQATRIAHSIGKQHFSRRVLAQAYLVLAISARRDCTGKHRHRKPKVAQHRAAALEVFREGLRK